MADRKKNEVNYEKGTINYSINNEKIKRRIDKIGETDGPMKKKPRNVKKINKSAEKMKKVTSKKKINNIQATNIIKVGGKEFQVRSNRSRQIKPNSKYCK